MLGTGQLRFSENGRPFWVLVALTVLLLAWVSASLAESQSPGTLVGGLRRDLQALRLQLEPVGSSATAGARSTVAFNADIGDGGPAFRHASLVTISRAASRRLERLIVAYHESGDAAGADQAAALRLDMMALRQQVGTLAKIDGPAARAAADNLVMRLDQGLARLGATPAR